MSWLPRLCVWIPGRIRFFFRELISLFKAKSLTWIPFVLQNPVMITPKTRRISPKEMQSLTLMGFLVIQSREFQRTSNWMLSHQVYSECPVSFGMVLRHFPAGMGSCPLQEFLGNNFLRRYFSFKYNLLATKYLSRRNWEWPCPIRHLGSAHYSKITGLWHLGNASSQRFAKK